MKNVRANVLECVGDTPIVKLNRIGSDQAHNFYIKLESMNPGSSVKDRIALQMVEDAERDGRLKPGGTIIECTSGNTGMGLAMVGAVKGYKCIFVMPDKVSDEKIKALRAFGARVITTPTAVEPDDPRSYYSVAKRLAQETPNSFYSNQYQNPSNPLAHYKSTGPEIWEQIGSDLDYFILCIGTGGTASGIAKYLKEKNKEIQVIGVDPEGSIYYEYFKTGKIPKMLTTYKVEGFGEDFMPGTMDFSNISDVVQVGDKECFQMARELARLEGIFVGGSCGGAVSAALKFMKDIPGKKNVLILLPDSGSRYLSKVFDDEWMRENRFLDPEPVPGTVLHVLGSRYGNVISCKKGDRVKGVVSAMREKFISQLPVLDGNKLCGLIAEVDLLAALFEGRATPDHAIDAFVEQDFKLLPPTAAIPELWAVFKEGQIAIIAEGEKVVGVVTKIDLIDYMSKQRA